MHSPLGIEYLQSYSSVNTHTGVLSLSVEPVVSYERNQFNWIYCYKQQWEMVVCEVNVCSLVTILTEHLSSLSLSWVLPPPHLSINRQQVETSDKWLKHHESRWQTGGWRKGNPPFIPYSFWKLHQFLHFGHIEMESGKRGQRGIGRYAGTGDRSKTR